MDNKTEIVYDSRDVKRSPEFVSLYINNTRFGYSKWDIQMLCGRISVTTVPDITPVEELAVISMSPQHAKAVLKALEGNIKIYEEVHGEIIMPKDGTELTKKENTARNKKSSKNRP